MRRGDETAWRNRALGEAGGSSRAWLWIGVCEDAVYFHVDPSRGAAAAARLFGDAAPGTVLVCDRYSAYKKLGRELGDRLTLAFCWVHARRDFIKCAAGKETPADWERRWIGRIARLYRLNGARLEQHDAGLDPDHRNPAFAAAHRELERALGQLFAAARRELDGLPDEAREGGPLRSLLNHRAGLSVFLDKPGVPMDNNRSERPPRGAAIGRRLSFGSDSEAGARFTATMYSAVGTLALNGVDVLRWLTAWLSACADNGGRAPGDLSPWLPWSMDAERRNESMAPG